MWNSNSNANSIIEDISNFSRNIKDFEDKHRGREPIVVVGKSTPQENRDFWHKAGFKIVEMIGLSDLADKI